MIRKNLVAKAMKRQPGYFVVLVKDLKDNIKFYKTKVSKDSYLKLYFRQLEENKSKHPEWSIEDLYNCYKTMWSTKFKLSSDYIDSYGKKWNNTPLSKKTCIEYLNNEINKE
jgi:hypothetical protein